MLRLAGSVCGVEMLYYHDLSLFKLASYYYIYVMFLDICV